jgi:hypothetical protein
VIPDRFSYEHVPSENCVVGDYVRRIDTKTGETERVALSHVTDEASIYILKMVDTDENDKKYNRYWEFEPGWDHFDDFLYNGAAHIFRGFDEARIFTITVNPGRVKSMNPLSTETYEHSISLHVPADHRQLDLPGMSGEASMTGDEEPVMFNAIDILNELYWVMREFSQRHAEFQEFLDGNTVSHGVESGDALRAYRALAMAYPFFEGLVYQLTDRTLLKDEPFKGGSGLRFKQLDHKTPQAGTKTLINQFETAHGVTDRYEREFLVETFYNETVDLGIARNDLAHNIFEATRGFQQINWYELSRRLIVSIAFLDEQVACCYSSVDSAHLRYFEWWLQDRIREGIENLHETVRT